MTHQLIATFGLALFFGIAFVTIAKRMKISPIVILLIGGIAVGPGAYRLNIIDPTLLGEGLEAIIQISVALILFEGGLTLDLKGYRQVSSEIRAVLTRGVVITWLCSAVVVKYVMGYPWAVSILAGSLIIVTGPTVIGPLLKRVGVHQKLNNFLHWEGVLIDPIGVFIALLCYEWIIGHDAILLFLSRFTSGIAIGVVCGFIIARIIRKNWIPEESLNIFVLAAALGIYTLSDMLVFESGLLSVVIAGFVIGTADTPQIDRIKVYKAQLIELLIGLLFVLLAANLAIDTYRGEYLLKILIAVILVMIVVRPLNIFISTLGSKNFALRDKLFLSWVAPRGIVAASMASLFALNLKASSSGNYAQQAEFLETFTYAVISGTVILQGFSAGWVARLLKVHEPEPTGWLIVGAHKLGRIVANFIQDQGRAVTLLDTNIRMAAVARRNGFVAISDNAITVNPDNTPELFGIGNVLAITENEELNELICQRWSKKLKNPNLYQWRQLSLPEEEQTSETVLSGTPIWTSLPLGRVIKMSVENKDISFMQGQSNAESINHPERVLMSRMDSRILPFLPENAKGPCMFLIYQPFTVSVDLHIKPEWITISSARSMSDIIEELLNILRNDYPDLETASIHKHMMDIENEYSSLIGFNIALPHGYSEKLDESIVMVAKTTRRVLSKINNDEVHLVFMVLSPRDKPNEHINTLSEISKFIMNEENREKLFTASSHADMVEVFFPEMRDNKPSQKGETGS